MSTSSDFPLNPSKTCFHCGLPVPPDRPATAEVDGHLRCFCCNGCKSVCQSIYGSGLEGFYKRTPEGILLAPPPELPRQLAMYDLDAVQEEFVDELGETRDINLLVEGIHCAACVWLIENSLQSLPGVPEARVNLSGRRLHVRWDNRRQKLSGIIQRLGQIGYAAVPYDPDSAEGRLQLENRDLLYRMAFAAFTMMNLLWVSIALYAGADRGEYRNLLHWVGFALATPTLAYSGYPFFKGAWNGLKSRYLGMDLPIAIGAAITYLYSVYVTVAGSSGSAVYYDTVVNFLFVILVGRYLEAISKRQAVASTQRLLDLQPRVATVVREGEESIVPISSVKKGELILVRSGERIPVDGIIVEGASAIDESMLTGESVGVEKGKGDTVSAGTINENGFLQIRMQGALKDTALGCIIRLVEEAQASKAPIQRVADRIVPWFVAVTIGLSIATFLWWLGSGFEQALMAATAVLIITCPCAFGLATPMAIAVASGSGARNGILVKNGEVLETLSAIDHFVFDKTGTLTEGQMQVTLVMTETERWSPGQQPVSEVIEGLVRELAALERYSEHPVAAAINRMAAEMDLDQKLPKVDGFQSRPGLGVQGTVHGRQLLAGTSAWLKQQGVAPDPKFDVEAETLESQGISPLRFAVAGRQAALIAIEDRIRADAPALIEALKRDGMKVTMLSGDRQRTAESIARRLGGMKVIAEVLPEQKDQVIGRLQQDGQRVVMVGDGVNDAPALVRADVGIALGSGTDVSIASADIVLISNELDKVRLASALSRRTLHAIRQNIGISITYNLIMVPLAMSALVTPLVAAVSMPISSLLVIANAGRISRLFAKN